MVQVGLFYFRTYGQGSEQFGIHAGGVIGCYRHYFDTCITTASGIGSIQDGCQKNE